MVDDKTDLNLSYFYYNADNFQNDSSFSLPLGASSREHGVTASLSRRLTNHLRMNMRYAYYSFQDLTFGGHDSFQSHLIYSSLQYRF